jgi:hypothetical protein
MNNEGLPEGIGLVNVQPYGRYGGFLLLVRR